MIRPLPNEPGEPRRVGDSLDRLAASLGLPAPVLRVWDEVVGPSFAAHAQPRRLQDGTLVVEVDDPAWATQVRWLESDLVRRLDLALSPGLVQRVEVRVARG